MRVSLKGFPEDRGVCSRLQGKVSRLLRCEGVCLCGGLRRSAVGVVLSHSPLLFEAGSLSETEVPYLAALLAHPPQAALLSLPPQRWVTSVLHCAQLFVRSHACPASTLHTEPFPQPICTDT